MPIADPNMRRPIGARRRIAPWGVVAWLLLVQFFLFRCYTTRQIAWAYPRHVDQAVYLELAYETYDRIVHEGLRRGTQWGMGFGDRSPSPNGAVLHVQAAFLFGVLGPGRVAALTLNFLYFMLLQIVLVYTVRDLSGRWSVAFIALGLLLAARTTFQRTGGIAEFRLDFATMCLFGVFVCLVIRSRVFDRFSWSLLAAAGGAYLIAFRFLTVAFFIPIFAVLIAAAAAVALGTRDPSRRAAAIRRCRNLVACGTAASIALVPVMLHHGTQAAHYYIGMHAKGAQRYIRAALFRAEQWPSALAFYPRLLVLHHGGPILFILAAAVLLVLGLYAKPRPAIQDSARHLARSAPGVWLATLTCFLAPLVVLTADVDKNAIVGNVLLVGLLWLIVLPICSLAQRGGPGMSRLLLVVAGLTLGVGMTVQIYSYTRPSEFTRQRTQVATVLDLYDRIVAVSRATGLGHPALANDSATDFLSPTAINAATYERHRYLLRSRELLAKNLLPRSPEEILTAVRQADFVLITRANNPKSLRSPFEQCTDAAHKEILSYCEQRHSRLAEAQAPDRVVILFGPPRR